MKKFQLDSKAMYFTDSQNCGTNVFWRDLIKGRGPRFFFTQLKKGLKCLVN